MSDFNTPREQQVSAKNKKKQSKGLEHSQKSLAALRLLLITISNFRIILQECIQFYYVWICVFKMLHAYLCILTSRPRQNRNLHYFPSSCSTCITDATIRLKCAGPSSFQEYYILCYTATLSLSVWNRTYHVCRC